MRTRTFSADETSFGFRLTCFENDYMTKVIERTGYHVSTEIQFLISLIQIIPDAICLDVGANIGTHALAMSREAAQVFAFEPQTDTFDLLSKNISDNEIENCKAFQFGLSDQEDQVMIYLNPANNGNSSIHSENLVDSSDVQEKIELKIADKVLSEENVSRVDLIKIDVEGHEPEALLGLKETIVNHLPYVLLEWNNDRIREGFSQHKLFETFFKEYEWRPVADSLQLYLDQLQDDPLRSIKRFIAKRFTKTSRLSRKSFKEKDNYAQLLFYPKNKSSEVDGLFKKAEEIFRIPNPRFIFSRKAR